MGVALVLPNIPKILGMWFPREKFATAVAVAFNIGSDSGAGVGMAMAVPIALSFVVFWGSGWRAMMQLFGAIMIALAILWIVVVRDKEQLDTSQGEEIDAESSGDIIRDVFKIRQVWILAAAAFFMLLSNNAYWALLPTALNLIGIDPAMAGLIAGIGIIVALPFEFLGGWWSDKMGLRKPVLIIFGSLMCLTQVIAAIFMRDVASALTITILYTICFAVFCCIPYTLPLEMKGIGPERASTTEGIMFTAGMIGGFVGTIFGGTLLELGSVTPLFIFYSVMAAMMVACFALLKETGYKSRAQVLQPD
jgi:nitrate/nitrite transporter NarK